MIPKAILIGIFIFLMLFVIAWGIVEIRDQRKKAKLMREVWKE